MNSIGSVPYCGFPYRAERGRLTLALLLSLLIHTLLLSLTFGGQGRGLPGFGFPWRERRIEAPDLRVLLVPARVTAAEPAGSSPTMVKALPRQASIEQTVAAEPALTPFVSSAPIRGRKAEAVVIKDKAKPESKATTLAEPAPEIATDAVAAIAPSRTEASADAAPTPIAVPQVIAVERSAEPTFVVPPPAPAPDIAVAPSAPITPGPETVMPVPRDAGEVAQKRAEPEVQERAVDVAKLDPPVREAEPQRQRQADQLEAARVEAARREAVRLATAQAEAQRQEVTRQEVARAEVARLEAARQVTDRQEAVRQAAAQKEAARILEEKEEDARRAARRQAMGRVLNEEAARREAAAAAARSSPTLPYSLSTARRARLWGRTDPNAELVQYAEAWARKIQFNTSVDTVREVANRPHTHPMVTVAIRSDGSVESVTFVVSSGVAEVDEAIRRIVQSLVPYPAFPPGLAREYDVIEVRRTWHFDLAIRLY